MKPIVPVLGIASVLWLFLGTWWMSNIVCTPNNAATFSVSDGKFNASTEDMFTFLLSSDKMEGTKNTSMAFNKIAKYLQDNPQKLLILTGLYGGNEKNDSAYDDLGMARGEKVKTELIKGGANGDNIRVTSMESDNLFFNEDKVMNGGVNFLFVDGGAAPSSLGSNKTSTSSDQPISDSGESSDFSFASGAAMFMDITGVSSTFKKSDSFTGYLSGLKAYLKNNPDTKLTVTCYNNDKDLADTIGRKVRSAFRRAGFNDLPITRKAEKVANSPSGIPGVNIVVQ